MYIIKQHKIAANISNWKFLENMQMQMESHTNMFAIWSHIFININYEAIKNKRNMLFKVFCSSEKEKMLSN